MRINIWIRVEEAVSGSITKYYTTEPVSNLKDPDKYETEYVQVQITQDEFAKLEDSKPSENDWGSEHWLKEQYNRNRSLEDHKGFKDAMDTTKEGNVIKEYLSTSGADFSEWWKSKSIAERQIITGYFGH